MKIMKRMLILLSIVTAIVAATASAAQTSKAATKPAADTPRVVKMTIHPAKAPQPALKYQLLPELLDQTPGNAAILYGTTAMLARAANKKELKDKFYDWLDMPLDELPRNEVLSALGSFQEVLGYAKLAARRERCDWDRPLAEGLSMLLPELASLRLAAQAVSLQILLEIAEGQYDKAIGHLQTGLAMGIHIGEGPTVIESLVAVAIADLMVRDLEQLVQQKKAPNLYWALTNLPHPLIDIGKSMRYERLLLYFEVPELRQIQRTKFTAEQYQLLFGNQGSFVKFIRTLSDFAETPEPLDINQIAEKVYPQAKQYLLSKGRTVEQVETMQSGQVVLIYFLDAYQTLMDDMTKWQAVPYWQASKFIREAGKRIEAAANDMPDNYFFSLVPNYLRAYFYMAKLDRQIAALRCIEAIRMYAADNGKLPAVLDDIKQVPIPIDPVTGESFDYKLAEGKAILNTPAPPYMSAKHGIRYELTLGR